MSYQKIPPAWTFVRGAKPLRQNQPRTYERTSLMGNLPGGYSLSLAQIAPLAPAPKPRWMLLLLAVVIIAAILWLIKDKKNSGPKTIRKASTAELAKNLYRRLEARPRRNASTMLALAQYAKE